MYHDTDRWYIPKMYHKWFKNISCYKNYITIEKLQTQKACSPMLMYWHVIESEKHRKTCKEKRESASLNFPLLIFHHPKPIYSQLFAHLDADLDFSRSFFIRKFTIDRKGFIQFGFFIFFIGSEKITKK